MVPLTPLRPLSLALTLLVAPAAAWAQDEAPPPAEAAPAASEPGAQQDSVERQIQVLAEEIERMKLGEVAPSASESVHGLGPAASKVYRQEKGLSLGGYGEVVFQNRFDSAGDARFDFLRQVLYVGYKFNERLVLNSEIEVEHANEIFLEFAYLDYLWRPELNFRAGLLLVPMGLINELHEPTTFLGALRPQTEQRILPTTWRENGVGVFGDVGPVSYRAYAVTGLNADGFSAAGLRGGRQKGIQARADDFAGVVRADWRGVQGLLVGGSMYYGGADHAQYGDVSVTNFIYEGHADFSWKGLQLRGLFARSHLDGAAELNTALELAGEEGVGEVQQGWYVQGGYDVLSLLPGSELQLSPFVRYEQLDTQQEVADGFAADPAQDLELLTLGASFFPHRQVVLKGEYQRTSNGAGTTTNGVNVLLGYIF
jgi:hypothetical protein